MHEISSGISFQGEEVHLTSIFSGIDGHYTETTISGEIYKRQKRDDNGRFKIQKVIMNTYSTQGVEQLHQQHKPP